MKKSTIFTLFLTTQLFTFGSAFAESKEVLEDCNKLIKTAEGKNIEQLKTCLDGNLTEKKNNLKAPFEEISQADSIKENSPIPKQQSEPVKTRFVGPKPAPAQPKPVTPPPTPRPAQQANPYNY